MISEPLGKGKYRRALERFTKTWLFFSILIMLTVLFFILPVEVEAGVSAVGYIVTGIVLLMLWVFVFLLPVIYFEMKLRKKHGG